MLAGRSILQRSVETFLESETITDIAVALPSDLAAAPPEYLRARTKPIVIVEGGGRRQDSVRHAFERVAAAAEIVVIHDAARPLVSDDLIRRTVEAAAATGAAWGFGTVTGGATTGWVVVTCTAAPTSATSSVVASAGTSEMVGSDSALERCDEATAASGGSLLVAFPAR